MGTVWDPDVSWARCVGEEPPSPFSKAASVSDGAWLGWRLAGRCVLGRKTGAYKWLVRPATPPLSSLRAWQTCFFMVCAVF